MQTSLLKKQNADSFGVSPHGALPARLAQNLADLKAAKRDGSWKGKGASNTVLPPNEQGLAMLEPAMAF